ncbi:CAF17-like 4Fe-4S cluster assembly/insertion protein YgfZ [Eionea flava]
MTFYPIQHAILLIKGIDAKKFLQGQVTCDIDALSDDNSSPVLAPIGAHCTHKGRVLFSFRALQLPNIENNEVSEPVIALSTPSDMGDVALAALQKYSVFSKVELSLASPPYRILGVQGEEATQSLRSLLSNTTTKNSGEKDLLPSEPHTAIHTTLGTIVCVAEASYELWLTEQQAISLTENTTTSYPLDNNYWHTVMIQSGLAHVDQSTSGEFTPHDLNYPNIPHAVSFKKGCYTGQEVVARMHYLGKLKKHVYLFTAPANQNEPSINGKSVFSSEKTQAVGTIIDSCISEQQYIFLALVTSDYIEQGDLYLDENQTLAIELLLKE